MTIIFKTTRYWQRELWGGVYLHLLNPPEAAFQSNTLNLVKTSLQRIVESSLDKLNVSSLVIFRLFHFLSFFNIYTNIDNNTQSFKSVESKTINRTIQIHVIIIMLKLSYKLAATLLEDPAAEELASLMKPNDLILADAALIILGSVLFLFGELEFPARFKNSIFCPLEFINSSNTVP